VRADLYEGGASKEAERIRELSLILDHQPADGFRLGALPLPLFL
jgi:hypothetical protein